MICWFFGKSESESERGKKDVSLVNDINNSMLLCYLNNFH